MKMSTRTLCQRTFSSLARAVHAHLAPYPKRTHACGELTAAHAGSTVVLAGWLLPERKISNALSFFPIKDASGTTQLVVRRNPLLASLSDVPVESVVLIQGRVDERPSKDRRPVPAGDVEVHVDAFTVLNPASPVLPFYPSDDKTLVNDELRARFRYLDLRRSALGGNIRQRSHVSRVVWDALHAEGFLEVETPLLLKSTPEGAREFLVPSRVGDEAAAFYSLPQSPQQPKQLLMCSGAIDKYFQFARCFRDEDGRKDRQPEFTQIDLEMAFLSWGPPQNSHTDPWRIGGHEVRAVIESLMTKLWHRLHTPFPVITYADAIARYGSDKPDVRFAMEIQDLTPLLPHNPHPAQVIDTLVVRPPFVRANDQYQPADEPNVSRIVLTSANLLTWCCEHAPTLGPDHHASLNNVLRIVPGDTLYVSRRSAVPEGASTPLGRIRIRLSELAQALGDYVPPPSPHFLWVTEFPLFTKSDPDKDFLARGRWTSTHHPFTAPMWQDIDALYDGRIHQVRGQHYDLVLNGTEIGGGSVRIHDAAMQEYVFSRVLELDESEIASFDHLLQALRCGAPPHGGIALGFDRLMSILCKTQSIRDVIAFPKTSAGTDPLFKSPSPVAKDVLSQYGIRARHEC